MARLPAGLAGGEKVVFPGEVLEFSALLYAPEGKGPFPAIVLFHGCNGMWTPAGEANRTHEAWAQHFRQKGYVALLVDSFGPRGEKEICAQGIRKIHPGRERVADAQAPLRWLARRADIRRERVHLLGWSNRGATVLEVARRGRKGEGKPGVTFRSAVASIPAAGT